MTGRSIRDMKEAVFGEKGPDPEILVHLAPFLSEPLLFRAIAIANAVPDPFQRAMILIALAGSAQLSEEKRELLVKAARNAANEISSMPERMQVLAKILPMAFGKDHLLLRGEKKWRAQPPLEASTDKERPGGSKPEKRPLIERIADRDDDERSTLAREALARLQTRTVNTGFASLSQASVPLHQSSPLDPGQNYYFWLDIGPPTLCSIEATPTAIPDYIPPKARLVVAIFPFDEEIEIVPGADIGELELEEDGTAIPLS